ncbi:hypothetical protein ANG4_2054, partial [Streptococcus anginosus 1505]
MTYNEKRRNYSLERLIWNNSILSQNFLELKTKYQNRQSFDASTHKEILAHLD